MNILIEQFAENLRAYRDAHSLTIEQLAARVGKHRTYTGQLESGTTNVSLDYVTGLAEKLDVHPLDLLDGDVVRADLRAWLAGRPASTGAVEESSRPTGRRVAANILVRQLVENVRAYRARRGISQERLAHELGRSRSYLGGIEQGQNVTLVKVAGLAAEIDVHPIQLLDGDLIRADRAAWAAGRTAAGDPTEDLRAAADGDDPGPRTP